MAIPKEDKIKEYLEQINKAVRGEEVRDAIIALIDLLGQSGNAYYLGDYTSRDFAKQADMDTILPLAETVTKLGTKPIGSADLYNYLKKAVEALNTILGNKSGEDGTIFDRAEELANIKKDLRDAIRTLGVDLKNESFDQYAGMLDKIEPLGEYKFETLNVVRNDVKFEGNAYKAELTPKSDPSGKKAAFSTVNINIQPNFKAKRITSLGTFTAAADNCDGFSEVEVSLSTGGGEGDEKSLRLIQKRLTGEDFPETLGAATFKASEDKAIGYSEVSVDVTSRIQEAEPVEIDPGEIEERTISASEKGLWGFSAVTIKIVESKGPFTVMFRNGPDVLETVEVQKYANAVYSRSTPTSSEEGMVFAGWSPDPICVTRNMECYAQFRKSEHIGFDSEIPLTWEEIGKTHGATVPVGAYKILYVQHYEYDGVTYPGAQYVMQKVYEGEEDTTSTWLSTSPMPAMAFYEKRLMLQDSLSPFTGVWVDDGDTARPCSLKRFMNEGFMNAIRQSMGNMYGDCGRIVDYIKKVKKYSTVFDAKTGWDPSGNGNGVLTPNAVSYNNYIWIPNDVEVGATRYGALLDTASPKYNLNANTKPLPNGLSRQWYNTPRSLAGARSNILGEKKEGDPFESLSKKMTRWALLYRPGTYETTIYTEALRAYRDIAIANDPKFTADLYCGYYDGTSSPKPITPTTEQLKFKCNFGFCL